MTMVTQRIDAFGLTLQIESEAPDLFDLLAAQLPPFPSAHADAVVDVRYQIRVKPGGGVLVVRSRRTIAAAPDVPAGCDRLVADLQSTLAAQARGWTMVHAGVVAIDGRALLLPGRSHAGKSTLVAELVRAGATYGSDEFAAIDRAGRVSPYSRALALRTGGAVSRIDAGTLGGRVMTTALPIAAVAFLTFEPGAALTFNRLSQGEVVLGLLGHCLGARGRPADTMATLSAVAGCAAGVRSARGEAAEAARLLLQCAAPGWPLRQTPIDIRQE